MIHTINYAATKFFNVLLFPIDYIGLFWGILFLSLLSSLWVLTVYRWVSSPVRVKRTKNQIKSNILAIRLYKDYVAVMLGAFVRSLFYTGKYFFLNLLPLVIILPPLFIVFTQMDIRYGRRDFLVGEEIVLKAVFSKSLEQQSIELHQLEGIRPLMKPVYVRVMQEVNWKLVADRPGVFDLAIEADGSIVRKRILVGESKGARSNVKFATSSWGHFIDPAESLLADPGAFRNVSIHYPGRLIGFLGIKLHWLIHYLALMLVIVLGLKKRFGVEF